MQITCLRFLIQVIRDYVSGFALFTKPFQCVFQQTLETLSIFFSPIPTTTINIVFCTTEKKKNGKHENDSLSRVFTISLNGNSNNKKESIQHNMHRERERERKRPLENFFNRSPVTVFFMRGRRALITNADCFSGRDNEERDARELPWGTCQRI